MENEKYEEEMKNGKKGERDSKKMALTPRMSATEISVAGK